MIDDICFTDSTNTHVSLLLPKTSKEIQEYDTLLLNHFNCISFNTDICNDGHGTLTIPTQKDQQVQTFSIAKEYVITKYEVMLTFIHTIP